MSGRRWVMEWMGDGMNGRWNGWEMERMGDGMDGRWDGWEMEWIGTVTRKGFLVLHACFVIACELNIVE